MSIATCQVVVVDPVALFLADVAAAAGDDLEHDVKDGKDERVAKVARDVKGVKVAAHQMGESGLAEMGAPRRHRRSLMPKWLIILTRAAVTTQLQRPRRLAPLSRLLMMWI